MPYLIYIVVDQKETKKTAKWWLTKIQEDGKAMKWESVFIFQRIFQSDFHTLKKRKTLHLIFLSNIRSIGLHGAIYVKSLFGVCVTK